MQIQSFNQPWAGYARTSVTNDAPVDEPDGEGTELPPEEEVDESKFRLADADQPSYGSYPDPDNPGEFISINTPEEAWQQVMNGGGNSLVMVDAAMAAGYQAVTEDLTARLAEQGVTGLAGTRINYGLPMNEEGTGPDLEAEPQFLAVNEQYPNHAEAIAAILNQPENQDFLEGFHKLGELSRSSSISYAQSRDQVLGEGSASQNGSRVFGSPYDFDFGLRSNGTGWQMDGQLTKLAPEDLNYLEKIHTV